MNQSTTAKSSKCAVTLNRPKQFVKSLFNNNAKKYNKIHVESFEDNMDRINKTKSKKLFTRPIYEFNIRPSSVVVQGFNFGIIPKSVTSHPSFLHGGNSKHYLICYYTSDLYEIYDKLINNHYTLYYKNKPLTRRCIPLLEYDYKDNEPIILTEHILIGGSQLAFRNVEDCISTYFKNYFMRNIQSDWTVELIEDLILYAQDMFVAMKSQYIVSSVTCATTRFIKKRVGGSLYYKIAQGEFIKIISNLNFFYDQSFKDSLDDFKDFLDNYENVKDSKLLMNIKKLISYAVAFSLFDTLKIPLDFVGYDNFEKQMLRKKIKKGGRMDFIHSILSSLHFMCERGYQYFMTGDVSTVFHSSEEYSKVLDQIQKLRMWSKLLPNCEAHGFSESEYRSDLDDSIESIQSIIRFNSHLTKLEQGRCKETLNELKMLRFDLTTIRASREHRDAPLGILINGDSGVGKSTIKDILFTYFGKLFNLPTEKTFCYTRNPVAKYWDGFVTSCWCIILDDIAFKHPNLGEDESCMEFLQINNSVPFVPDQAALESKGRTPLKAKLVIGTTNTKHLNAHFYFSCASAAQRRFPFIITPEVKSEFRDHNGMLDTSKCVNLDGEYPNYWNFTVETVKNLKACSSNLGRPAEIIPLAKFTDINEFLQWFGQASLKFSENQKKVNSSIENIQKIRICRECLRNEKQCICYKLQSLTFQHEESNVFLCFTDLILVVLFSILSNFSKYLGELLIRFILNYSYSLGSELLKKQIIQTGAQFRANLGNCDKLKKITLSIAALGSSCYILKMIYKKFFSDIVTISPQSTNFVTPQPQEIERENVWYNSSLELSSFNTTPVITSSKSLTREYMEAKIARNVYFMSIKIDGKHFWFRIFCVKGNKYVMNNHSYSSFTGKEIIEVISAPHYGVSRNIKVRLTEYDVKRYPDKDLCIITIRNINPGCDLTKFFSTNCDLSKQNGFYVTRNVDGSSTSIPITLTENVRFQGDNFLVKALRCTITEPTKHGDCGMPLILNTPMGYIIAGIHVSGLNDKAISTVIDKSFIDAALADNVPLEGEPMLTSQSAKMVLGELHPKSVFNYIENGSALVYGSFLGFRRKPKSCVEDTPLMPFLKKHGYVKKYTAPMMNGYVPFRIAALDMVNPVTNIDTSVVDKCTKSFLNDILQNINIESVKMLVEPYNMKTAINGAVGVAYVDRMKISTSAGNPWKCKKEKFLPLLDDGTDDRGCTIEIQHRVNKIIDMYLRNTRAHPVFCAHLKDEAVTFKKADIGKTRVFTGAPMDWTIVVRMYYLSLIRLIQNNKYAFETAVGTTAQSMEWFDLLSYLMWDLNPTDGKWTSSSRKEYQNDDRLKRFIAGDYKAFDKRMAPVFILAAFSILIDIAKLSENYSEIDLQVMWCIAYDTAFPTVDFNGDLLQFLGSNPSGHPLTVIINSLVNSLYQRYAYNFLNPKQEVDSFRKQVRLITYGDDNTMNSRVNWFNHTAISDELSKIGVIYTMADKEAESVPFIHMKDVSFLKRTWVWNHELKTYLAPLEHDSIEKMLMTWTRSKIAEEAQVLAVVESAISEYFFYGKKIFKDKVLLLREILESMGYSAIIKKSTFPTWNQMKSRFRKCTLRAGIYVDEYDFAEEDGEIEMEIDDFIVLAPDHL